MSEPESISVIGAGGHARVVLSTRIGGVFDDNAEKWGTEIAGAAVIGSPRGVGERERGRAVIAIGDNRGRRKMAQRLAGWEWVTVVHPHAWVHPEVALGEGTVVFAGAVIQPDCRIGDHCIVNTSASIDHDGCLGDFTHLAPGVHLAGEVTVGEGALMGIGSVALPGRTVGPWAVVGAGSVVVQDIPEEAVVAGNPARALRAEKEVSN